MMKIDLHVHARERSACATEGEENQIRAAVKAGLNGFAFTDHNRLVNPQRLAELRKKYAPFRIFTGIEVDADMEHWVVIGVYDPLLESGKWHYPELHDLVRQKGGFIILAHPFRYRNTINADLQRYTPDGIEVHSYNTPAAKENDIRQLAKSLGILTMCNSDAHWASVLGLYYNSIEDFQGDDGALMERLCGMKATV